MDLFPPPPQRWQLPYRLLKMGISTFGTFRKAIFNMHHFCDMKPNF